MTELETLIREYARDLRRNSSGGDDYPWEIMIGVADYLEVLIGRAALAATPAQPSLTIEDVRKRMPKYVSSRAREFACEAMNDMVDEIHDGGVYALAQWFDALAAALVVGGEPVAYRWRQPGNKHWIYDPTPEWIEDHKDEIELEPLFVAASASPLRGSTDWRAKYREVFNENKRLRAFVDWVDSWVSNPVGSYGEYALGGIFGLSRDRIAALSAAPPEQPAAAPEVQFLLDRLEEYDPEDEDHVRDFHGHVAPAIARLRNAVTNTSDGMISVNRETDFQVSPIKSDGETKA